MSQQSMKQAARRSALAAQAVLGREVGRVGLCGASPSTRDTRSRVETAKAHGVDAELRSGLRCLVPRHEETEHGRTRPAHLEPQPVHSAQEHHFVVVGVACAALRIGRLGGRRGLGSSSMDTRKIATLTGWLMVVTFVTSIPAYFSFYAPVRNNPGSITGAGRRPHRERGFGRCPGAHRHHR
jgi:hypothetical protein